VRGAASAARTRTAAGITRTSASTAGTAASTTRTAATTTRTGGSRSGPSGMSITSSSSGNSNRMGPVVGLDNIISIENRQATG
jgi:hypothetical protein